ncbi:MAG: cobyric acid synthase [Bacillota bacterium]
MKAVMLQGTGSDVGKSILTAGICRALVNRGLKVRPFKSQNMSNNAAPAFGGGEIGRAQALQAMACRTVPTVDMNPVLLKPESNCISQVIVQGEVYGSLKAGDFNRNKKPLLDLAVQSFRRLRHESDIVVAEGGGSPAEVNLRQGDIANMGFARAVNMPVVMVGDINRGGVIASLVGTRAVLDTADAAMIKGFIINKFRGDMELFRDGERIIEKSTGWRDLGVVPWLAEAGMLPAEDSLPAVKDENKKQLTVAVPVLPHIANFDDFEALQAEAEVNLTYVYPGQPLPCDAGLVILPGTKTTVEDLQFFRDQGWEIDLKAHIRRGGYVLGICGGYQMLGRTIADPLGVEGEQRITEGLGLLPVDTVLAAEKRITETSGVNISGGAPFYGYEIHCGRTVLADNAEPLLRLINGKTDGAVSADGRIAGCYIHRLFDNAEQRAYWLGLFDACSDGINQREKIECALDSLAEKLETYLDIDGILEIASL